MKEEDTVRDNIIFFCINSGLPCIVTASSLIPEMAVEFISNITKWQNRLNFFICELLL